MMTSSSTKNKLRFVDGSIEILDKSSNIKSGNAVIIWSFLGCFLILIIQSRKVFYSLILLEKFGRIIRIDLVIHQCRKFSSLNRSYLRSVKDPQVFQDSILEIKPLWDEVHDANPLPCCTRNKCTCNLTHFTF